MELFIYIFFSLHSSSIMNWPALALNVRPLTLSSLRYICLCAPLLSLWSHRDMASDKNEDQKKRKSKMLSNRRVICNEFLLVHESMGFFSSPFGALFEEPNLNVCCSIIFCCSKCAHIWILNRGTLFFFHSLLLFHFA